MVTGRWFLPPSCLVLSGRGGNIVDNLTDREMEGIMVMVSRSSPLALAYLRVKGIVGTTLCQVGAQVWKVGQI